MFPIATSPPTIVLDLPAADYGFVVLPPRRNYGAQPSFNGLNRCLWTSEAFAGQAGASIEPVWSCVLREAASRVRELRPGWDGPGSKAIARSAIFLAETIVRNAIEGRPAAVAPYLVPSGDGSVQIEWHERNGELELLVDENGSLYIWGRSHFYGQEFEGEGEKALALFARWAPQFAAGYHDEVDVSAKVDTLDIIAA
jgi:hypothetical protein